MSGIVFMKTAKILEIRDFYTNQIGCEIWLDQGGCIILQHGNFLFGFCQSEQSETQGVLTFFYPHPREVDQMFIRLKDFAVTEVKNNPKYKIYHFYAQDPEHRSIEFQSFNHSVLPYLSGMELLSSLGIDTADQDQMICPAFSKSLLERFKLSPELNPVRSAYYKLIEPFSHLKHFGLLPGDRMEKLNPEKFAVAVCSDPKYSNFFQQEAGMAAYHLMLGAGLWGFNSEWIGDFDQDQAKNVLNLPSPHFLASIIIFERKKIK